MKPPLILLLILVLLPGCSFSQDSLKNYSHELSILIDSLQVPEDKLAIRIDKSEYRLSIVSDTMVIKEYPVVFGGNPVDDKLRQGDRCTPEGTFRVLSKYPHRSWDKFIWIDYPNDISWEKHRKAKEDGLISESDGIGGEIGIHGVPVATDYMIDVRMNWTLGCISLKNDDINDIYPFVRKGTIVVINP